MVVEDRVEVRAGKVPEVHQVFELEFGGEGSIRPRSVLPSTTTRSTSTRRSFPEEQQGSYDLLDCNGDRQCYWRVPATEWI